MTIIAESKLINGKPARRLVGTPAGAWIIARSPVDAMLDHVKDALGITATMLLAAINVDPASLCRARKGEQGLPESWVLRMQDYSGIPASELRRAACLDPFVQPHPKAVKS